MGGVEYVSGGGWRGILGSRRLRRSQGREAGKLGVLFRNNVASSLAKAQGSKKAIVGNMGGVLEVFSCR